MKETHSARTCEPNRNTVVARETDEGIEVQLYLVSASPNEETSARTYSDSFGHYFVHPDSEATELLDELVQEYMNDKKIISSFQREDGMKYELVVKTDRDIRVPDNNFHTLHQSTVQIPADRKQYVDKFDEILRKIRSEL